MTISEIRDKCNGLQIVEERKVTDNYLELVFETDATDHWRSAIRELLGKEKKAAGMDPSQEDLLITKDFGGIRQDQILFKKDLSDETVIAMFWPWRDDEHTTLKVALIKD